MMSNSKLNGTVQSAPNKSRGFDAVAAAGYLPALN